MRFKREVKTYKQAVVNAVILVAILCIFLYLGVQFSRNFSTQVSTQRTQVVTDSEYVSLSGYVFRDETLCRQSTTGVVDYLVADGEKVSVGMAYADFYPMQNANRKEIDNYRAELYDLSQQIKRLSSQHGISTTVSDLDRVGKTVTQSYYAYINSIFDGDFAAADQSGELLLGAIVDHSVITGQEGVTENILSRLEDEKSTLTSAIGVAPTRLYSSISCYFFHSTDGYEASFSSDKLEGMTPDALQQIIESDPEVYGADVIGKTIFSPKWHLALPTDEATCLRFTEGKIYEVSFEDGGETVKMMLDRICLDESGSGNAYLLFSSQDLSIGGRMLRAQDVKILMSSCTGYRIPAEALTSIQGESGVFIQVGNVVEFRRVTVIGEGNSYLIVNTYEKDYSEGLVSEIPYLKANDLIITSGNDLYDGKLLD